MARLNKGRGELLPRPRSEEQNLEPGGVDKDCFAFD